MTAPSVSVAVTSVETSSRRRRTVRASQMRSEPLAPPTYCTVIDTVVVRAPGAASWPTRPPPHLWRAEGRPQVLPPAGAAYLDRTHPELGKIREGDALVRAVDAVGWGWGGRWRSVKDYQHLSSTGR